MKDKTPNFVTIELSKLEPNKGQLHGLPSNPRKISDEKLELLKQNIEQYPEMLTLRGLMVYPYKRGKYIIIAGNMRHRAMSELGYESAPCVVLPKETSVEQLKAYAIIDNNGFGQWDWDMIADDWDKAQLSSWGLPITLSDGIDLDYFCDDEEQPKKIDGSHTIIIKTLNKDYYDEIKQKLTDVLKAYNGITIR